MGTAKRTARLAALEEQGEVTTQAAAIVAQATGARPPITRDRIGVLLLDLLAAKLEASKAVADAARAALQNPAWLARQDAGSVATLAAYLDESAFALGDRLAAAPHIVEATDER
jgi:hypothetical protein